MGSVKLKETLLTANRGGFIAWRLLMTPSSGADMLHAYACARPLAEQAKRLDDAKNIKLRQLEYSSRGITEFSRWVEKAKVDGMFRGEVHGPILLEVAIADPQHAKYLEQQMPRTLHSLAHVIIAHASVLHFLHCSHHQVLFVSRQTPGPKPHWIARI